MATIASEFRDVILELARKNDTLITNPVLILNEYKVGTEDWPALSAINASFMSKVKPYAEAAAAGQALNDRASTSVIMAYAAFYRNVAKAVVDAQNGALAAGRYRIPAMSYYFPDSAIDSFKLINQVVAADEKTGENALAAYRAEIKLILKEFVELAKKDGKNIDRAREMARLAANQAQNQGTSTQEIVAPPPSNLVTAATSTDTGVGGKIAIAAAVVVGGFILWKFFTRNR